MEHEEIMDVLSQSSKYILIAMAALGKANEGILQVWQEFETMGGEKYGGTISNPSKKKKV